MDKIEALVERIRDGDTDSFGIIVRRFQDMAVGYGYSILGDFQLAQDAAQEAFFEAYRDLAKLREPAAFPGWFRRIVFKQCDRIIRRKSLGTVPLDGVSLGDSGGNGPLEQLERNEMMDTVFKSIDSLPEQERAAVVLYYIGGHSQSEIAQFLDVPVTTVKKRLHSARHHLREMLIDLVEETLRHRRPSRDEAFSKRLVDILAAARTGDSARVKNLLELDPRLLAARDPFGNTALILAVNFGHEEIAQLLLASGLEPDIHEAAAIGSTERLANFVDINNELLDSYSSEGFTPLALAAHFGHRGTVEFLVNRGADVNLVSQHQIGVTPMHAALFGQRNDIAMLLLEHGADPNVRRGGKGLPRAGWTALHYAANLGAKDLVEALIARGADTTAVDDDGFTPPEVARRAGKSAVINILETSTA